jgi:hypothetical protein
MGWSGEVEGVQVGLGMFDPTPMEVEGVSAGHTMVTQRQWI